MNDTTENTESTPTAEMAEKLAAAGEKAEAQKNTRRERVVKGSHLLPALTEQAKAAGLTIEDKSGFLKVNGGVKGKNVYIAKKGGRVDLSGFTVEAAAVKQISEQDAREKHLGKVRGQLDFNKSDDEVLSAFSSALTALAAKSEG
jgi:hypothetical protein